MDGMSDSDVLQASDIEPLIPEVGYRPHVHGDWNEEEALVWQEDRYRLPEAARGP